MSSQTNQPQVRKRRVFYIPGYDPFPPRRYRELYRTESQAQAMISGYDISISAKSGDGPFGWHVVSQQEGVDVHTDVAVLVWSDIVRDSMSVSIPATYLQLIRTAWIYISTGALRRLMRLRKGPVIAAFYPVGMLLLQLITAGAIAIGATALLWSFAGWWGILPAMAAAYGAMRGFRRIDNRLFAYYLMHDYAYSARLYGAMSPEIQARLDTFATQIAEALNSDVDEVLVVGHSSGAHLAVLVLARLIRQNAVPDPEPALSLLTLGQVMPMVSFLPRAHQLRSDLQVLSAQQSLTWVDVSAPGDGCAFALCDPVAVSGVAGHGKRWPLVLSAAFTQTLTPERWQSLRWRFFRLHFQYLCAFDRPGRYDYFRITAGPETLASRFDGSAPSRSRIETAVSKHVSVRA
ncbi:MAG: alpha/beta hydrolase [Pseudomonadota bacterium]